jgi:hypothetical protein
MSWLQKSIVEGREGVLTRVFFQTQFLPSPAIEGKLKRVFHGSKSLSDLLAALYTAVATLSLPTDRPGDSPVTVKMLPGIIDVTAPPVSLLGLLPHLPTLHLSLLISATRLETVYDVALVNFEIVHRHYLDLITRSKLQRSSLSSFSKRGSVSGAGLRTWGKETARGAWEELAQWEVIVPTSSTGGSGRLTDEGLGGDGVLMKMFRVDVTLDEIAWAVTEKLGGDGAGETLMKWCKEI